ncbi:hypothetical protein QBC39DRAFT_364222 [Podospora conica]|nr:hypothetical protein QBC39DRAFT_364222 [Schizothecium conicum]
MDQPDWQMSREATQQQQTERIMEMVLLRMNFDRVRARLVDEIQCFDECLKKILIMAEAFTVSHTNIDYPATLKLVKDDKIVTATVCRYLEATNAILRFLAFVEKETGILAGGDIWLTHKIANSRVIVQNFLTALVAQRKGEDRPGMAFSLRYSVDIRVYDHSLVISNGRTQDAQSQKLIKDQDFSRMELAAVKEGWHCPSIEYPAIHVPGTQWHKYFGNLNRDDIGPRTAIFDGEEKQVVRVRFPAVAIRLEQEMRAVFTEFQGYFHRTGRLPFPRKPVTQKAAYLTFLMQHLSIGDHQRVIATEETSEQSPHEGLCLDHERPERDAYGNDRFEYLNLMLNEPHLSGIALRGDDIDGVADKHVVETYEFVLPSGIHEHSDEGGEGEEAN